MTPNTLRAAGEALYGPRWQTPLARVLGVNDRTVRRWAAGQNAIPAGIADELRALLRERRADIGRVIEGL